MANCCYCGKKVGFLGTKLKDGASICTMCSYICGIEFAKKRLVKSSAELSKFTSKDILKFFTEEGVNHDDINLFKSELPSFIQKLKKTLNIRLKWQWKFIGENDFSSSITSFNKSLHHRGDEVPVAFYDESLFGNNTSGILITTKRIYHVTSLNFHMFELYDTQSISSFRGTIGEDEPYCRIKWCSSVSNIEISGENPSVASNVLLFWGNLFNYILTKKNNGLINYTQKENEIQKFYLNRQSNSNIGDDNSTTPFQSKMLAILLANSFSDYDKSRQAPISDWGDLSRNTPIIACEKYSLLSWGDYAFYTSRTVFYHCKKQSIHMLLNYNEINGYNATTGILDYGSKHKKINISLWNENIKNFIKQISHIKQTADESDTSILEFCFNHCTDFRNDLRYFKLGTITSAFKKQCQQQHASQLLRENFDHIEIKSMNQGKIELKYWAYFPKVKCASIEIDENDSDYDIQIKEQEREREQQRLDEEAEEQIEMAQYVATELPNIKDDIVKLFQMSLYNLYGVLFDEKNITFLDEPDFTFEGPSLTERIKSKIAPVESVVAGLMESTARQMADVERKYGCYW